MDKIIIDGFSLNWEQVRHCLYALPKVSLAPKAKEKMEKSRLCVEEKIKSGETFYGINTGFGKLANTRISPTQLSQLQENIVYSHAVALGTPLPEPVSRLTLLLQANCLAQGTSGCRTDIVLLLCEMINKGVTPVLPSQGSVGACGDLAPLAHIAKVLIGDGEVWYQGEKRKSSEIFKKVGLTPVVLEPKEGLSLVNGTHFSLAIACDVLLQAEKLLKIADITGALSVEGDLASFHPFDEALLRAKPHSGSIKTGNNLRKMLAESEMNLVHKSCNRVQDPYSLRCMPQVHGAAKDAFSFVKNILEIELNSSTDNPLVFTDTKKIISGGNFHGESIAMAMDFLSIALAELGSISERRVALLINPIQNEIPTQFLIPEPGIYSGFMIPQVVMSALVSENKTLAHPASVDSIPTSAGQEDHVSMSSWAARKAKQIANNVERILSIELLAGAQAIDFVSKGKKGGKGVSTLHHYIRKSLPVLKEDKYLNSQLQIAYNFVETGVIIDIVEKEIGPLDI